MQSGEHFDSLRLSPVASFQINKVAHYNGKRKGKSKVHKSGGKTRRSKVQSPKSNVQESNVQECKVNGNPGWTMNIENWVEDDLGLWTLNFGLKQSRRYQ